MKNINNLFFIILVLFSGTDKYGLNIFGINLRYIYVVVFIYVIINLNIIRFFSFKSFLLLLISHMLAIINASYPIYSYSYIFWIIINYLLLSTIAHNVRITPSTQILSCLLISFRVLASLIIVTFVLGLNGYDIFDWTHNLVKTEAGRRVELWHFEPSNLAVQMSFYLFIGYNNYLKNRTTFDIYYSLLAMIFIVSTTSYVAIIFFVIVATFYPKFRIRLFSYFFLIISLLFYLLPPWGFVDYLYRIYTYILDPTLSIRFRSIVGSFSDIYHHIYLGHGPYVLYNFGSTPPNITLELLLTVGLIGTFFFYNYIFKIIYVGFSKTSSYTKILSLGVVCSLLLLQSSQNYLRVYFWIHLGIVLGYYLKDKYYSQSSEYKLSPQMQ